MPLLPMYLHILDEVIKQTTNTVFRNVNQFNDGFDLSLSRSHYKAFNCLVPC